MNTYYTKIDFNEFYYKRNRSEIFSFTDQEIKCLERFGEVDIRFNKDIKYYLHVCLSTNKLYKMVDEWYYVYNDSIVESYYKCDQFEGLIKCLENVL